MTKKEKEKIIDVLKIWIESCEGFYKSFEKDFPKRPDAVKELQCRCDKVIYLDEFLYECGFISIEKYFEIEDRYENVLDNLAKVLK